MLSKRFATRVGLLAVLCLTAGMAFAQKTKTIDDGLTVVKLSSTFTSALESLGVTPGTVEPTRICDGVASFPIVGGAIDLDTAAGNILHSGGLTLSAGNTKVKLQSFIIDTTGSAPQLTGIVVANGKLIGRIALFDLALPPGFSLPLDADYGLLKLKGVGVTLTSDAAGALNQIFGVTAFTGGFSIGKADVFAVLHARRW